MATREQGGYRVVAARGHRSTWNTYAEARAHAVDLVTRGIARSAVVELDTVSLGWHPVERWRYDIVAMMPIVDEWT